MTKKERADCIVAAFGHINQANDLLRLAGYEGAADELRVVKESIILDPDEES